jgi:tetratricopeptide (TPR) repeat protein
MPPVARIMRLASTREFAMRGWIKVVLAGLFCLAIAAGVVMSLSLVNSGPARMPITPDRAPAASNPPDLASQSAADFVEPSLIEDGGIRLASEFTGTILDPRSLRDLREAIQGRGRLGLAVMGAELGQFHISSQSTKVDLTYASQIHKNVGLLHMYEGQFEEAAHSFETALELGRSAGIPARARTDLIAILGIVALRRGEVSNCIACVGPSSCIFPIAPEAAHTQQAGSRAAIEHFTASLRDAPGDIRVRWLLNLAYMTLGEYPQKVPAEYLVPIDTFRSNLDLGRFNNVASAAGLTARGPNMAGGSVFDDFNGDGLPD